MPANTEQNLKTRPPIVVVMGHIDHGKTTLLDYIRINKIGGAASKGGEPRPVAGREAGGITQHVGAYEIEAKNRKTTLLDTPGHEAFSKIRTRGAKIADIAVLVVAADDKVNSQTIEAIEAIKESKIPFVVAINKIDKENASPDKIKKELSEKEVQVEDWGGKVPCMNISAKTGQGVDELLEMIGLMADMEELKTDSEALASGYVIESHVDSKRGVSATLIIQNGKLKQGNCVAVGNTTAPVKIFENFLGKQIKEAEASSPVKIIGFNKMPSPGAEFKTFICKKDAEAATTLGPSLANLPRTDLGKTGKNDENKVIVPIIIKADAMGSAEALEKQIKKLENENEKILVKILRAGVGDVNEDDLKLAISDKNSIIIGFNVKDRSPRSSALIKLFKIIYEAEDWLKEEIQKREPKEKKEEIIGRAKILKIFKDEKSKKIIGGEVRKGVIRLGKNVRIYRRDFMLGEGKILELQQNKTKSDEVTEGNQFGAILQTKVDIAAQDILEIIEKIIS